MHLPISVIICTHNPREAYLQRVLGALQQQTLPPTLWELLLVDNRSETVLATRWDLSWHPNSRHVREEELGLTLARLRGIAESRGQLLIFVDDDNVLEIDYLECALSLRAQHPHIGAFGGSIRAEFEVPPPEWIVPYLSGFVVSEIHQDYWSNLPQWSEAVPYGAGLCVVHSVAKEYSVKAGTDPIRRALGRVGEGLGSGEDGDLSLCATDVGLGTARFHALRLTHLIPRHRLTKSYVVRLYAGFAGSSVILRSLRKSSPDQRRGTAFEQSLHWTWQFVRADSLARRIMMESRRARSRARDFIEGSNGDRSLLQS